MNVESGTLNISAGDDALHSDYTLNIGAEDTAGPVITISTCSEAMEGATVNIFSGTIDITATDDCLNAANGDLTDYDFSMNISGGTITAYTSGGDGFDSNGSMTISGAALPCGRPTPPIISRWMRTVPSPSPAARYWQQAAVRVWATPLTLRRAM